MNIAVVGLGLIGGSFCKALKANTFHHIMGIDADHETEKKALEQGAVDEIIDETRLGEANLTIVALYPVPTVEFVKNNADRFRKGSIVIDVGGVKGYVVSRCTPVLEEKGEKPLLVVCDEISDPHNLGAILRTAECAGAHGLIIPKRRSAGLTAIVGKTSAGAVSYMPVARVSNLPATLEELKKKGVWVYGTAAEGTTSLYDADLKGPAAIVIGSEGSGMGRLVREKCDFLVSIPMKGHISSLNASAAAAILLYEAVRRRM